MTREEATQILATWLVSSKGAKGQCGDIEGWFDEEDVEAFRMAIEALMHECDSCIWDICNYNKVDWDAELVHGEWLPCDKKGFLLTGTQRKLQKNGRSIWCGFKCSKCGFIYKGNALTESEFCQNCGAKMLTKRIPETLSLKADGEVVSKGGE